MGDTTEKAIAAVTNNSALMIAVGVILLVALGLSRFNIWMVKANKSNSDSIEEVVNRRVREVTGQFERRIQDLENEVHSLRDSRKSSAAYLAKALTADALEPCKNYIVQAMESLT